MSIYEPLFAALEGEGVRYVVVGGMAVVLHGYLRVTADLDLAIDLSPEQARGAIETLLREGLRPSIPVEPLDFADPEIRRRWTTEKGMTVFSLHDPADPRRSVDLFVDEPIDFDELWTNSERMRLGEVEVHVACIPDLIRLKRMADRPQDRVDIGELEGILRARKERKGD